MLSREEVLKLAKEAATKTVDYDLTGKPITDADVVMLGAYGPFMERFAALIAAQYEQDALRYRWLREQNETLEWNAMCVTSRDFTDEEGPETSWVGADLDAAIDQAMEQTK